MSGTEAVKRGKVVATSGGNDTTARAVRVRASCILLRPAADRLDTRRCIVAEGGGKDEQAVAKAVA